MADEIILETKSSIPGLASLSKATARPICRYDGNECCSARYIFHARVVLGWTTSQKFTLSYVIAGTGTTTDTSLSLAITEHTLHRTVEKTFDIKN